MTFASPGGILPAHDEDTLVHNPSGAPEEELPTVFGFDNGGSPGFRHAVLIAEDGECLGDHVCSHEGFMPLDLGLLAEHPRESRVKAMMEKYPGGFRTEFVSYADVGEHEKLSRAIRIGNESVEASGDE